MRSLILALTLAATGSAFAATPNFTNPVTSMHTSRPSEVYVTFVNTSSQERSIRIGDTRYQLATGKSVHMYMNVGSTVQITSNVNSKVNSIMQLGADAQDKTIHLQ